MFCLIAVENNEAARVIKENLQKIYPDYTFDTCTTAKELQLFIPKRPDILLVSRFLNGGVEPHNLLRHMPTMFPASHVVLLTGKNTEEARAYIKLAEQHGLINIVTGPLPGDRPYTLMQAVKYDIEWNEITAAEEEVEEHGLVFNENFAEEVLTGANDIDIPVKEENQRATISETNMQENMDLSLTAESQAEELNKGRRVFKIEHRSKADLLGEQVNPTPPYSGGYQQVPSQQQTYITKNTQPMDNFREPEKPQSFGVVPDEQPLEADYLVSDMENTFQMNQLHSKGKVVISAANKGGVGKTTVAITAGVALSKAGVKVCMVDLDLEGPNVATFFKIKEKPGIEQIANSHFSPTLVDDLLVEVNENLFVLPGVMDNSIPYFEHGKLERLLDYLTTIFPVVVVDTPPNFRSRNWLEGVFSKADMLLAVVDQSIFSEQETSIYAPELIMFGVKPEAIRIVLNKYSPKLHNLKILEKQFNKNLSKNIPKNLLPRVAATIPENWEGYVKSGYKGQVAGLEESMSQWHNIAAEIAQLAGYRYNLDDEGSKKGKRGKGLFSGLFGKLGVKKTKPEF